MKKGKERVVCLDFLDIAVHIFTYGQSRKNKNPDLTDRGD